MARSSIVIDGSIKYCRVHDLLRDFAMHRAGKENFVTVFANPQDTNHRDRVTRRASLQSCPHQFMEYVGPKTRSLFLFNLEKKLPNLSKFTLLRVLEMYNVGFRVIDLIDGAPQNKLRGLDRLIHLKFLCVRACYFMNFGEFSFGRLKNLETLYFRSNINIGIPSYLTTDLWTINTLRCVVYDWVLPEVPSKADLPNLQSLEWIPFNNKPIPPLNNASNLRNLGLDNESTEWDVDHAVPHLLGGLPSLTSLKIKTLETNLPMEIVYPRALPNYQNLQILELRGRWSESVTLKASLFPSHLIKLTFVDSYLKQDPMTELGKLNNLKKLLLLGYVYGGKPMICPAGFPVLQSLTVNCYGQVFSFTVAKGVMPKLKHLWGDNTVKFELPPELMHVIEEKVEI